MGLNDYIYIMAYVLTEFLNCTFAYTVLFGSYITTNKRKILIAFVTVVLFHCLLLNYLGRDGSGAITVFTMMVIPLFMLEPIEKKNFLLYPFVVITSAVIGISISFLIASVFNIPEYIIEEGSYLAILCQCTPWMALFILKIYRKHRKNNIYDVNLDIKQYTLFYIVVICLFLLLATMQGLTRVMPSGENINVIGLATSIACLVLVIVTIWQGISVNREIQLKERNRMSERYLELQKEYYSRLLEQDEKMRRFRHDMRAHIITLQSYCDDGNNQDLRNYLNAMIKESAVYEVEIFTGNKGIDAVLRELISTAEKNNIDIEINGKLTEKVHVNEYDLCTIISNLLTNAIEACERISDISARKIVLKTGVYNSQVHIMIKNTVAENVVIKNNHLFSTKKNSKYHGIGSKNVENTVNKYEGIIEYRCEDGWFVAEVSI